ncbi:unnamed protein product, partial [Polarella glacialis]
PTLQLRRGFAVLAHKWTDGRGAAEASQSQRVVLLMHGILGSKSNWNTPAKQLLKQVAPLGWRILQLDHRAHGDSPSGEGPHTLESCAADVEETLCAAGLPVDLQSELVVCGHSFGGKVALAFAQKRLLEGRPPRQTWIFDSIPGCPLELSLEQQRKEQSVSFVLSVVELVAAHGPQVDRAALIASLESQGLVRPVAQWVAQSSRSAPCGGMALGYDVLAVRELYDAYRNTDLWSVLENNQLPLGVIVAGRNQHAWGPENLSRLARCNGVTQVTLKDAGHNVHVDDLPGLLRALEQTFAE